MIIAVFWRDGSLLTAQAFTAIALVNLLGAPVISIVQLMPQLLQCVGSFERIREYCNYADDATSVEEVYNNDYRSGSAISLRSLAGEMTGRNANDAKHAICLENNSFAWSKSKEPFLKDIDLRAPIGSVTICVGAVGSGKSMLLESVLGETICSLGPAPSFASSIAYCAQQPWLENGTIRSNIIGVSQYDRKWYKTVKSACGLDADLQTLERGDKTVVGSKGLNLSGGQKQRIVSENRDELWNQLSNGYQKALARAVYSRSSTLVLDDVFSGMDAHTVDNVSQHLLGNNGLLRKRGATVILATHSRMYTKRSIGCMCADQLQINSWALRTPSLLSRMAESTRSEAHKRC